MRGLGCQSQIGVLKTQHMNSVDYPAIYVNNEGARILWEVRNGCIITSDPKKGIEEIPIENFSDEETIKLLLIKKSVGAATTKFGWSWFLPLVKIQVPRGLRSNIISTNDGTCHPTTIAANYRQSSKSRKCEHTECTWKPNDYIGFISGAPNST